MLAGKLIEVWQSGGAVTGRYDVNIANSSFVHSSAAQVSGQG